MRTLIDKDDLGNWALKGVQWNSLYVGEVITENIHEKLYGALCKLKDYEATGLSPEEVERVISEKEEALLKDANSANAVRARMRIAKMQYAGKINQTIRVIQKLVMSIITSRNV